VHTPRHAVAFAPPESAAPSRSLIALTSVLDDVVHSMSELAPGAHVGISAAAPSGTFETLAGTDPLVFVLDDLQYDLDEGPCLTAMREGHTVTVEDAESDHRWPRFLPRAVDLGLSSHAGLPFAFEGKALGGLNMYSTKHMRMDPARLAHAKAIARQAAIALQLADREERLLRSLTTSRMIGKAIGLVMERHGLDEDAAYQHLVDLSHDTHVMLRVVAQRMVAKANKQHRTPAR
jgi:GAF domain-containing protein